MWYLVDGLDLIYGRLDILSNLMVAQRSSVLQTPRVIGSNLGY